MRYVQINSFYNGSTGSAMRGLHARLAGEGVDSYIFWGRRHATVSDHERCCATRAGVYAHGALSRVTDRAGFYSRGDTARLLDQLDQIGPDTVHLHNVHGYYVNVEMLFGWLAERGCDLVWTLHDCWAFTGHCPHFQFVGCDRWKDGCHDCPQRSGYPSSLVMDQSARNWQEKRRLFTLLPPERVTLVSPSRWLADLVAQSYLSKYRVEVRPNQIDRSVFRPTPSDLRERYGIGDRRLVLGVASPWSERKGLGAFARLAAQLDDSFAVVLVGLNDKQVRWLERQASGGARVVALGKTESRRELAAWYTTADVFFNPTLEDNYPTVNLEAEACGTPVVTFDTGGCRETIHRADSVAISADSWLPVLLNRIADPSKTKGYCE